MADVSVNFRSSMHGFNRDDVITFIESSAAEHEEALRALKAENESLKLQLEEGGAEVLREELNATRTLLGESEEKSQALEAEVRSLEEKLAAAREELAAAQAAQEEARSKPALSETPVAAEASVSPLNAPIAPICETPTEAPKNYEVMELAAYRRAELAERLARERANKVYDQLGVVFGNASERLDANEADLRQLTEALEFNMGQLGDILSAIRRNYADTRESFRSFSDRNAELPEE